VVEFYKKLALVSLSFLIFPALASAATLSIAPATGTYKVGDTITVRTVVGSDASLNAVSAKVLVSPIFFAIQSISETGSIIGFWVTEPSFDKVSGVVNFEGVALSGFQGSAGTVATIQLKALKAGTGNISFQSGQILANDGKGTDITGSMTGATFTIVETTKSPPVQPPVQPAVEPAAVATTTVEALQPLPSLQAPEIVSGTKYGVPSIIGSSDYPKAQVLLTFVSKDGAKIFITGTADIDGSFNLVLPNSLKHGDYEVSAIMVKEDKTNSERSNIIIVKVGNILSDTDPEIMWLILLIILAILYLLVRTYYHFMGDKSIHKRIKYEAREVEDITHKSFDILREDIADYEAGKSAGSKQKAISEIEKDIDSAEKVVEKEIKDIGSV
jgi:hypothetical protein